MMQLSPVNSNRTIKNFVIQKGQSLNSTADNLQKEGLIRSAFVFKFYVKQQGSEGQIQAGTFKLSSSMSAEEILNALKGNAVETWVTLLEGWRTEEMAEKLNKELGLNSKEFLKVAKEGYMFPDTYLFSKDITVGEVAKKMRDNFDRRFSDDIRDKIKALDLTENEGVILASVVEREARSDQARTMVASILLKRFNTSMGLNADATIQYALGYQDNEKSWWKRHLSKEDLKIDSPYNTYLYVGLPPTPISNPSLSSLKAVANADPKVPYLYYYHDSKGNSHYAETLDEHNINIANNP